MGVSCRPNDEHWHEFMWTQLGINWLMDHGCHDSWGAPAANESLLMRDWENLVRNDRWAEAFNERYIAERSDFEEMDLPGTDRVRNNVVSGNGQVAVRSEREKPSSVRSEREDPSSVRSERENPSSRPAKHALLHTTEPCQKNIIKVVAKDGSPSVAPPAVPSKAVADVMSDARSKMAAMKALNALKPSSVFRAGNGNQPLRILCYGDSLTVGFSTMGGGLLPYGRYLSNELAKKYSAIEVFVFGLSGAQAVEMAVGVNGTVTNCARQADRGLGSVLEMDRNFDLALIMAGTNDLMRGKTGSFIMEHVQKLHEACHTRGVKTIAVAAPKAPKYERDAEFNRNRDAFAETLADWVKCQTMCVSVFDPATCMSCKENDLWDKDRLHLDAAGACRLGTELADVVAEQIGDGCKPSPSISGLPTPFKKNRLNNDAARH